MKAHIVLSIRNSISYNNLIHVGENKNESRCKEKNFLGRKIIKEMYIMMGWGYSMMGGWFGMMLFPLILIGIIIYAAVRLFGNANHFGSGRQYNNSLEILDERFVKGEINEEEYKHKKEMLMKR